MDFHFVDAENIGLNGLKCINSTIEDKVFVFSKNEKTLAYCQQNLFIPISNYPSGSNQADFFIISTLSRIIFEMKAKSQHSFLLHSNDAALNLAFVTICKINGVKAKKSTTNSNPDKSSKINENIEQNNVVSINASTKLSKKILTKLHEPKSAAELRKELKINKNDINKEIQMLLKEKMIKRSSKSKKKWIAA